MKSIKAMANRMKIYKFYDEELERIKREDR